MKFVFVCVALVCVNLYFCRAGNTSINQGEDGANEYVRGEGRKRKPCKCPLQDPNKPSAHIESAQLGVRTYHGAIVIKDWSLSAPNSHLLGGMKYHDGQLIVPIGGRYNIYAQIYFSDHNHSRLYIRVNDKHVTIIQPDFSNQKTKYVAGVFILKAGDVIALTGASPLVAKVYMASIHTYFGAFLI